jgi:transposase
MFGHDFKFKYFPFFRIGNCSYLVINKLFFSVVIENHVTSVEPVTFVGIDVGLNYLVTLSDGTQIDAPRYYRNTESELRRQHRNLSRKKVLS